MPQTPLRIVFAGTPEFSASHLKALIDSEHQLIAAYTQPDRPAGRGKALRASPVKQLAEEAGIPVYQPATLRDEQAQATLAELKADVMVVVAYGLILPQEVLDTPTLGCLNVHASLLPRWRGAAPIQRAIEAGDNVTGITIMQMDAGLDTGAMLATASCEIGEHSAATLHDALAELGSPALLDVLNDLENKLANAQAQDDSQACYAQKILKSEAAINWADDASVIARRIRAFNPFPVCFATLNEQRVRIWRAQPVNNESEAKPGTILGAASTGILVSCGRGNLLIEELQLPGAKALSAEQVLNARRELFAPGRCFSPVEEAQQS